MKKVHKDKVALFDFVEMRDLQAVLYFNNPYITN